jgi:Fe-S cluster assembly ATP-binding protein
MLDIKNLKVSVEEKEIIHGLNLNIKPGEVHAIMGPNGSGKSTLTNVLSGKEGYTISGDAKFLGENLLELAPEERARKGLFTAFQYPVELPGVSNVSFLKASMNSVLQANNKDLIDAADFLHLVKLKAKKLQISEDFLYRNVNEGFSGGEKKRNEMLQMLMLEPKLNVLDETDSGLDIDALKIVANSVNSLRSNERSFIIITHYQRLLDYIKPDFVHVLYYGKIVKSGTYELALELEEKGYEWLSNYDK